MDFKYIKNIGETEATILLYDQIGISNDGCYGIDGAQFAYEIQYLQDKCSKINVRINSVGGSVIDGYSIISSILNCKVPVDTYIDGIAASIAAVISMCGTKVRMMDYGILMIHNPSGGDQQILDLIKKTLVTILSNRTSYSLEQISKLMDDETYFTCDECMRNGMIDEVISSNMKVSVKKESLYNLATIYNKLIKQTNTMENENEVTEVTNETNETETSIEVVEVTNQVVENEVIEAIDDKYETLLKENEELKTQLENFLKEKVETKRVKVEEMVNSFVISGKIKEDEKSSMIELASVNFDGVFNMLSKIGSKSASKITNVIEKKSGKENWNIRDYEKNAPKELSDIKNNDPELYNSMFNDYYKK